MLISFLAAAIASLGLMANSSVAIVGAMLVAPLMKPIMSLAYSMAIGNGKLAVRSILTLAAGSAVAVTMVRGAMSSRIETSANSKVLACDEDNSYKLLK